MNQRYLLFAVIGLTLAVVIASLFIAGGAPEQPAVSHPTPEPPSQRTPTVTDSRLQVVADKAETTPKLPPAVIGSRTAKPVFLPAQQRYRITPEQVPALLAYAAKDPSNNGGSIDADKEYLLHRLLKQCRQPISDKVLNQQLRHLEQRQQDNPERQQAIDQQKQRLTDRYLSCLQLTESDTPIAINNAVIRQRLETAAEQGLAVAQVDLFMQYSTAEQRRNPELLFQARAQCSIDGFIALMQFYSQDSNNPEQDIDSYSHLVMVEKLLANYQPQPQISQMLALRKQLLLDNMYVYEQQQAARQSEQYEQQYCQ